MKDLRVAWSVAVVMALCAATLGVWLWRVSVNAQTSPVDFQEESPMPGEVLLADEPEPPMDGCDYESLAKGMEHLLAKEAKGNRIREVKIIAWAAKGVVTYAPPRLHQEVIAAVRRDREPATMLVYLSKSPFDTHLDGIEWRQCESDNRIGAPWKIELPGDPSEEDIIGFVEKTAFGRNEYVRGLPVFQVVLYTKDMALLRKHLESGVAVAEKVRRRDAYEFRLDGQRDD